MAVERTRTRRHAEGVPDEEIPEMFVEDFRRARPVAEVMPDLIETAKRARGRPKLPRVKTHVSLRLDPEIVHAFKAEGPGWQGRINLALARVLAAKKKSRPKKKAKAQIRPRKRTA
jgi:uncharacterized protein (DUF4415 family)